MLLKNAIQKIHVYAYDSTTGAAKVDDEANITGYVSLDGTANAIDDTNPAQVDKTNMPGVYVFDLTAAETNCDSFALYAKSSTSNIRIEPIVGFTTAGTSTSLSANAVAIAANAITATAIADDAIAAAKVKADAVTKIQAGLATPTNITAGTITTVTNLTNLPAITANWLTAAGIQDGAITNAKVADDVDVNAKTITAGAISATTFAANALDAVWSTAARTLTAIGDSSGVTTLLSRIVGTLLAGNHTAQTGDSYARLGEPAGASVSADVAAVHAKTTNLPAAPAAVGSAMTVSDKTGFKLAADGLDQISATPVANPTTWAQRLNWVMQRFFYSAKTPTALVVKAANGDTLTTQALTDDAEGTETMGLPS